MPFRVDNFQESIEQMAKSAAKKKLLLACDNYRKLTARGQKTIAIKTMMDLLDQSLATGKRNELMQSCGRRCICASTLKKAIRLQKQATSIDSLVELLNANHIGGGFLRCESDVISAEYHRCYCGSVSKTNTKFSPTYCQCSCGWYSQLFETALGKPVRVELLGSIIQENDKCRFKIYLT
jgi:hypothetical protein